MSDNPRKKEDLSHIFNPECRNDILLQHIKYKCRLLDEEDTVELSDETGKVKNLRNYPTDYAAEHLQDREILILLKVEGSSLLNDDQDSEKFIYVPLLHGLEENQEYIDTLNPKPDHLFDSKSETKSARRKGARSKMSNKTKSKDKLTKKPH